LVRPRSFKPCTLSRQGVILNLLVNNQRNTDMNYLLEAQAIAEAMNRARLEGKAITDQQTVRLCEVLDILLSAKKV